jgi:catechol 2,3-dioxygenase-like lactoylglutathione lyase family enzyme
VDVPGVVWLEHLNLVVGDISVAKQFYVAFLGLSEDEDNAKHFNLGQQQVSCCCVSFWSYSSYTGYDVVDLFIKHSYSFCHSTTTQFHLAATDEPPQRVTGSIGLTVPNLQRIRDRVETAQTELEGTMFSVQKCEEDSKIMTVSCPWGNTFHLYDMSIDDDYRTTATITAQKMVNLHLEGGAYGSHRMAVRGKPGIRFAEIATSVGTIDAIARFYETMLGCIVLRRNVDTAETAAVSVGPGVHLVFVESPSLSNDQVEQMKGVHACIYISSFQETYQRLKKHNLIWTNPRFTHLDSCDTWEEAVASRTLRFKDVLDLETGDKLLEFEHETRPLMHGQYMKVPRYVPN